ncbi:hypothetical protein [Paenibacillus tepidiphilus]|uniref:hypothetical protein n=1 Tax=Paenibacillus tepidiphilus TaxID=2608683 RepID=UPI0012392B26|nr:hypothetical protein [Paenibacillus tepidiphilus]
MIKIVYNIKIVRKVPLVPLVPFKYVLAWEVRRLVDMTRVLDFVTLPQTAERRLHSDAEVTLAKIRLIQKALRIQEAQISMTLSEIDLKAVEESVESIPVTMEVVESFISEVSNVPEFLSVRDVSKLTGRVPQVIRRHCANGKYDAEQVTGENGTWRIKSEQFMHLSTWDSFLKERKSEIENSKRIVDHATALWDGEGPVDIGPN